MKNAKGSHREWRITGRKERAHEVKTHKKKGWILEGICDTNDAKIQNRAECAGEEKKN